MEYTRRLPYLCLAVAHIGLLFSGYRPNWVYDYPQVYLTIHCVIGSWLTHMSTSQTPLPFEQAKCVAAERGARVTTVYAAGLGGDINQLARYVGPLGFKVGTRHVVWHRDAALLFYNPWLGKDGAAGTDVQPHGVSRDLPWWFPGTLQSLFITAWTGVQGALPTRHDIGAYTVGQGADVHKALAMVQAAMAGNRDPQHRFVLLGSSRGAAVMLQVAACLTPEEAARVGLLVLEGVFDTIPNVLEARYGKRLARIAACFLRRCTSCDPASPVTPLAVAKTFPHKNMPVLVVGSAVDWHVPAALGQHVHDALKNDAQLKEVTHLVLKNSHHSRMSCGNVEDRAAYARTLEALYEKHIGC